MTAIPLSASSRLVVMDTTLRDGEQTPGVSFSPSEKLSIAQALLERVRVDRIEVASALVSDGERRGAEAVARWAAACGRSDQIEALAYCDGERSVAWLEATGVCRINLLMKGSLRHCRQQLGLSLEEHLARAAVTVEAARKRGMEVAGVWLEDWSRGVVDSPDYVMSLVGHLWGKGLSSFYLADTLGVLSPATTEALARTMRRSFPHARFEFHAHNDYGLAVANTLSAVAAGVFGVHTTVGGLGERAGNASLAEVVVAVRDHTPRDTGVDEARLPAVVELVAAITHQAPPVNAPIVGRHVFTQTAGIHADGDAKAGLYVSRLGPDRFGRHVSYALGKHAGKASLDHHLRRLGVVLGSERRRALLARIVRLGDLKRVVVEADLPQLIRELGGPAAARCPAPETVSVGCSDSELWPSEPAFTRHCRQGRLSCACVK